MKSKTEISIRALFGTYFPWFLYGLALLTTLILVAQGKGFFASYLQAVVFFNGGLQGLWAGGAHLLAPEYAARQIGWVSNGFQLEMGGTNIALGISGLLSWFFPHWRVPVALIIAIIFAFCAYIHLKERFGNNNQAPCNSGPMLYVTMLVSITLFIAVLVV